MNSIIALFALFAAANAVVITNGGLYGAPLLASTYAGVVPTSRLTRSDWVQPGLAYNVPAVARYQSITPGFTTLHRTAYAAPVVATAHYAASPLVSAGLIGSPYTAGLAAPLGVATYIRK